MADQQSSAYRLAQTISSYHDDFMMRTIQGKEVDEAQVDRWVAEAEVSQDVDKLRARWGRIPRGASATRVIPVRLPAEELAAVMTRAEREGLNRSEVIRAALADTRSHCA